MTVVWLTFERHAVAVGQTLTGLATCCKAESTTNWKFGSVKDSGASVRQVAPRSCIRTLGHHRLTPTLAFCETSSFASLLSSERPILTDVLRKHPFDRESETVKLLFRDLRVLGDLVNHAVEKGPSRKVNASVDLKPRPQLGHLLATDDPVSG